MVTHKLAKVQKIKSLIPEGSVQTANPQSLGVTVEEEAEREQEPKGPFSSRHSREAADTTQ